jgi:hypothetical protein
MTLPPNIPKRGLSLAEAAEYCGISNKTLQRHGPEPSKIGDRIIYDRHALDRWLDELTGLKPVEITDPEEQLLQAINARKTSLRDPAPDPQSEGTMVLAAPRPPADQTARRSRRTPRDGRTP